MNLHMNQILGICPVLKTESRKTNSESLGMKMRKQKQSTQKSGDDLGSVQMSGSDEVNEEKSYRRPNMLH